MGFKEEFESKVKGTVERFELVKPGEKVLVACSGGKDSTTVLYLLKKLGCEVEGLYIDLLIGEYSQKNLENIQKFCEQEKIKLQVVNIREVLGSSMCFIRQKIPQLKACTVCGVIKRWLLNKKARELGFSKIATGHNLDDQAETLLLQLLRGAGPHGLAAMPTLRENAAGAAWWRPLLGVTRASIDAYARDSGLAWIDDESNADRRHTRNAVRETVLPALLAIAPQADATLARAAAHQAEAARLLDELAQHDAQGAIDGATLQSAALGRLSPHRARNLLRWFLRCQGLPAPSSARLSAMLDQLRGARIDASIRLAHAGVEIGVHRGRIALHATPPASFDVRWRGEKELALPHGTIAFGRADGAGIDLARLGADVRVRSRAGGERFQVAPDRPRRALKSILRDAGIPPWERRGLPLVFSGDVLAAVAGLGIDADITAAPGRPGLTVAWHPRLP